MTIRNKRTPVPGEPDDGRGVEFRYGDVLEPDSIRSCIDGVDFVFTCFGLLGKWGVPDRTFRLANVEGIRNVLEAIPRSGIRQFIHMSSAGVLGPLADGVVADESYPFGPSNIYEMTKCEAEREVQTCARQRDIPFTIIRPEFVYGPGDLHVLGLFKAIARRRFILLGSGKTLLHPTYIDDLIRGIALCTGNKDALNRTYLITGKAPVTVKELGSTIAEELGVRLPRVHVPVSLANVMATSMEGLARLTGYSEPILSRARVKYFTENRAFTCAKARKELGYLPAIDLREGVRRTVRWYRERNYL
jgi:dihydroflavonol-4-reductase